MRSASILEPINVSESPNGCRHLASTSVKQYGQRNTRICVGTMGVERYFFLIRCTVFGAAARQSLFHCLSTCWWCICAQRWCVCVCAHMRCVCVNAHGALVRWCMCTGCVCVCMRCVCVPSSITSSQRRSWAVGRRTCSSTNTFFIMSTSAWKYLARSLPSVSSAFFTLCSSSCCGTSWWKWFRAQYLPICMWITGHTSACELQHTSAHNPYLLSITKLCNWQRLPRSKHLTLTKNCCYV